MALQPREPVELVVEFRPRLRIAVRQVDAGNDDAADGGFDVARIVIAAVAGQRVADQDRPGLRQDRNAVPGLLPAPERVVAGLRELAMRKVVVTMIPRTAASI